MNHLRHQNYKTKQTEMEYFKNIQKGRILEIKNSLLELEIEKDLKKNRR